MSCRTKVQAPTRKCPVESFKQSKQSCTPDLPTVNLQIRRRPPVAQLLAATSPRHASIATAISLPRGMSTALPTVRLVIPRLLVHTLCRDCDMQC